ncbi:MAG: signal peptidase I [Cellvibrionaceae bacterium]
MSIDLSSIDFSLWLLVLSAVSGLIWLLDALVFARMRREKVSAFLSSRNISVDEFKVFVESLDEKGRSRADMTKTDIVKQKLLERALVLHRESIPVGYARSFFPILFTVLLLRAFLFEPFQIPSGSMMPTLNVGDFIVVNKFAYGLRLPVTGTKVLDIDEPKRGDVMVFIPPHDPRYFIKRVIGLPGDRIRYTDDTVFINGEPLPQKEAGVVRELGVRHSRETAGGVTHDIYTHALADVDRSYSWLAPEGAVVPEGHYFMMGDNRDGSEDSRSWGPVSERNVVGKAVAVWMHKEEGWHLPSFSENRVIENAE